jgi:SAM-dependent methyltransferase
VNKEEIRRYLAVIDRATKRIEELLGSSDETVVSSEVSKPKRAVDVGAMIKAKTWPLAVSEHIASRQPTQRDKENRASGALSYMVNRSMEGIRFLDYGCGDGYIAAAAAQRGVASSTGYDITENQAWGDITSAEFVTNPERLPNDYYDMIFVYDVVDHSLDAVGMMQHVYALLKPGGVCYVRCHPWTSRHASHLYKFGLNRAYAHLFLTYDELVELGATPMFTRAEKDPLTAYNWFFSPFSVEKEHIIRKDVDPFFLAPTMTDLLFKEQEVKPKDQKAFLERLSLEFVDYVLVK